MSAKKSKEVCRVLWFDERGRFAKAPNKPTKTAKPKPRLGPRKTISGKPVKVRVDGGGVATIRYLKSGVAVRYIPPAELRAEAKKNKNPQYQAAYREWIRGVQLELAKQANEERRLRISRKHAEIMERELLRDKGRKGAAERAKSREIQKQMKDKAQSELLKALKSPNIYEKRAARAELKARGIGVNKVSK